MQEKTLDMNKVIALNIVKIMKEKNKKQIDLAVCLNVSKQIMSKILSGDRTITALELKKIATYLEIPIESLFEEEGLNNYLYVTAMGKVETEEAKKAILTAVKLSNMICKYDKLEERLKESKEEWEA